MRSGSQFVKPESSFTESSRIYRRLKAVWPRCSRSAVGPVGVGVGQRFLRIKRSRGVALAQQKDLCTILLNKNWVIRRFNIQKTDLFAFDRVEGDGHECQGGVAH